MSAVMDLTQQGHYVNLLAPVDINGAAQVSDYMSLKNYASVYILIQLGVTGAASTVTVEESDDNSGSNTTAIGFRYRTENTAAGDTFDTGYTTATASGFATSTNDTIMYVIKIDASELTDGYPYIVVKMSDPGAATLASISAIAVNARYAQDVTPTAIT